MLLEDRILAFEKIGNIFLNFEKSQFFIDVIDKSTSENTFFTKPNVKYAFLALGQMLSGNQLRRWLSSYEIGNDPKKVGVIIPANIPLVGFYDFLCVLLSGNIFVGKLSSSNTVLLPFVSNLLSDINPKFKTRIFFKNNLNDVDLLIATGNDNSADYFNYLFQNKRKIIRKNRNSIAVLTGSETDDEYIKLAHDIFMYFGLGCRSISKIFVPLSFDVNKFKKVFQNNFKTTCEPYLDNYNYNKAIFTVESKFFLDLNNLLIIESAKINSPISVLYYEYYDSIKSLQNLIYTNRNQIQCIVSNNNFDSNVIRFGDTQNPTVFSPPDQVDVLKFLTSN